ncbi:hypothetical protein Ancab_008380, partial [Ancistrocladus abbreviatus]
MERRIQIQYLRPRHFNEVINTNANKMKTRHGESEAVDARIGEEEPQQDEFPATILDGRLTGSRREPADKLSLIRQTHGKLDGGMTAAGFGVSRASPFSLM